MIWFWFIRIRIILRWSSGTFIVYIKRRHLDLLYRPNIDWKLDDDIFFCILFSKKYTVCFIKKMFSRFKCFSDVCAGQKARFLYFSLWRQWIESQQATSRTKGRVKSVVFMKKEKWKKRERERVAHMCRWHANVMACSNSHFDRHMRFSREREARLRTRNSLMNMLIVQWQQLLFSI